MLISYIARYLFNRTILLLLIFNVGCSLLSLDKEDDDGNIIYNEEITSFELLRMCYREKLSDIEYLNKKFGTPISKHSDTVRYGETSTYTSFDYLIYLATKDNPECVIESYYWSIATKRDYEMLIAIYYLKSENNLIPVWANIMKISK